MGHGPYELSYLEFLEVRGPPALDDGVGRGPRAVRARPTWSSSRYGDPPALDDGVGCGPRALRALLPGVPRGPGTSRVRRWGGVKERLGHPPRPLQVLARIALFAFSKPGLAASDVGCLPGEEPLGGAPEAEGSGHLRLPHSALTQVRARV